MASFPGHGFGPIEGGFNRGQQGSIPVLFQRRPTSLNRVVFAVVGWIVDQVDPKSGGIGKFDDPLEKLSSLTVAFRSIVAVEDQFRDVPIPIRHGFPPLVQAIDYEIAGFMRTAKANVHVRGLQIENPKGNQFGFGLHIMIERLHRVLASTLAVPGIIAHCDGGFGIQAQAQTSGFGLGCCVDLLHIGKNGVRFRLFF